MKVNSKIDAYNLIMFFVMLVVLAVPNFVFKFSWIYLSCMVLIDIIVGVSLFTTRYELTETELKIKTGPMGFGVEYDRIKAIKKTKSYFSSSCSTAINSLEITFGSKKDSSPNKILISPQHEDEFLLHLSKYCKNLDIKQTNGGR